MHAHMQARYFTGLKHVTLDVLHMSFLRVTRVTFSQCSHAHDARTPHHFVMIVVGWGPKPPGEIRIIAVVPDRGPVPLERGRWFLEYL